MEDLTKLTVEKLQDRLQVYQDFVRSGQASLAEDQANLAAVQAELQRRGHGNVAGNSLPDEAFKTR